jgi:AcrR family transcriptional regulator
MAVKKASGRGERSSAEERRQQVIEAAVKEFAENGFHATSTAAIAKRAGISQPYIYALFPNKRELFLAADRYVVDRIRGAFLDATRGKASPEERLEAMGHAYIDLLENRDEIRFQMQAHAAAGNPELAEPVRQEFTGLWEDIKRISGASDEEVVQFMAKGMLLNVIASLELPDDFLPPRAEEQA